MRDFKRLQSDPPSGVTGCALMNFCVSRSIKKKSLTFFHHRLDLPLGISAPHDDDIMEWNAVIFGPDDTPWEGATFKLKMSFTEDYPNKPPKVRHAFQSFCRHVCGISHSPHVTLLLQLSSPQVQFVTKCFHPNVYGNGGICLDILQNQWSPIYDIAAILTSIQSLLSDPNPNSPANVEAAKLFQENRREYDRRVVECVELSWDQE